MSNHSTCRSPSPWPSLFVRKLPSCQRDHSHRPGRCRTSPSGWSSRLPAHPSCNSNSRPTASRLPAAQQPPDRPQRRCPRLPTNWQQPIGPSRLPRRRFQRQPCPPEQPVSPQRLPVSGVPARRCCLSDWPRGTHPAPTALGCQRHSPLLHPCRSGAGRRSPLILPPQTRRCRGLLTPPHRRDIKAVTRQPCGQLRCSPASAVPSLKQAG